MQIEGCNSSCLLSLLGKVYFVSVYLRVGLFDGMPSGGWEPIDRY